MVEPLTAYETGAWSAMLADAVDRLQRREGQRLWVRRSDPVASYEQVQQQVRAWPWFSPSAVLLMEHRAVAGGVADLAGEYSWPPPGVLGARDGSWVLEPDLRVTALQ